MNNNNNNTRTVTTITMRHTNNGPQVEIDIARDFDGVISVSSAIGSDFGLAACGVTKAEALAAANDLIKLYRARGFRQVGAPSTQQFGV